MSEFALIFRATRSLTSEELPVRNAAAREWALSLQARGVLKHAFPLEEPVMVVRPSPQPSPEIGRGGSAIASVLVIDASDFDSAVALVKTHPGLAFGSEIEVRPVKSVVSAAR